MEKGLASSASNMTKNKKNNKKPSIHVYKTYPIALPKLDPLICGVDAERPAAIRRADGVAGSEAFVHLERGGCLIRMKGNTNDGRTTSHNSSR